MNRRTGPAPSIPAVALLILLLGAGGCSRRSDGPGAAPVREYPIRGIVRGIDRAASRVTVEHEDVPGFMPAMTMPFNLREAAELGGVAVGEAVRFRFRINGETSWIEGIQRIDAAGLRLPKPSPAAPATGGTRLKEGDRLDAFELIDQAGRPVTRATFGDRAILLSFIFVRCPVPEYCPLVSRQLAEIERRVADDPLLAGRVGLLSVSFDPEDTPPVLAEYGARFARDPDVWRFATGAPAEIARLTHAFSVQVKPEAGTLTLGLCTALIDPAGRVVKLWRGNGWRPDEVVAALRGAAGAGPVPAAPPAPSIPPGADRTGA